jgi:hypothetical protein
VFSVATSARSVLGPFDVFSRHDVIEYEPNDTTEEPGFDIDETAWRIRGSYNVTQGVH